MAARLRSGRHRAQRPGTAPTDLAADLHHIAPDILGFGDSTHPDPPPADNLRHEDRLMPVRAAHRFGEHLPNAQVHILPEAGHRAQIEQPERFGALVGALLTERLQRGNGMSDQSSVDSLPGQYAPDHRRLDQRSFRDVLGRFTTGVVLITAATEEGPVGMAANSFTSVSLDPPMVGLCAAYSSTTWPSVRATGGFAVTILGDNHLEICRTFAAKGADRFAGTRWDRTPAGHPLLPDGLAWLDCEIQVLHRAGDHELVVARATCWSTAHSGKPLVFHSGRYTAIAP